jgi:hypothetical protein
MSSGWWLLAAAVAWLASLRWTAKVNYRYGVWDGAFNRFLPCVREHMRTYDPYLAAQILDRKDAP